MIKEINFKNSDSLWNKITNFQKTSDSNNELIYRGHSSSNWDLLPTVLRRESIFQLKEVNGDSINCEHLVSKEFKLLQDFIHSCDQTGITVPNDSVMFRRENLTQLSLEKYIEQPEKWPNEKLLETMAMARLHSLPTRLLDWTKNPYIAVYFAASQALRGRRNWYEKQKLSILVFNKGLSTNNEFGPIKVLRIRGAISQNIVAQQGLFTVHPILEKRGEPLSIRSLENYLPDNISIQKLTVPIRESVGLYKLCNQFGFNAAKLYPGTDGASRSVIENQLYTLASRGREE